MLHRRLLGRTLLHPAWRRSGYGLHTHRVLSKNPCLQLRPASWFKKPKSKAPTVIIEEPERAQKRPHEGQLKDFKHYLKTTELAANLRRGILGTKLESFIHEVSDLTANEETLPVINNVFMELYTMNGGSLKDSSGAVLGVLGYEDLVLLFEKSATALLSKDSPVNFPEYMSVLAQFFLKTSSQDVKPGILVQTVDLASSVRFGQFRSVLNTLVKNKGHQLTPDFTLHLIKYYENKNTYNLAKMEDILLVANNNPEACILDDFFYYKYIQHVEEIYRTEPPKVHQYKNLDLNVNRVQNLLLSMIDSANLPTLSVGVLLRLAKLAHELDTVAKNERSGLTIAKILSYLTENPKETQNLVFEDIRREIFRENLEDESLVETLLHLAKAKGYHSLSNMLHEFVEADDVKFSRALRFQNRLYRLSGQKVSEQELYEATIAEFDRFMESEAINGSEPVDIDDIFQRIVKAFMATDSVSPRGYFTITLTNHFSQKHRLFAQLYAYKARLDKAIQNRNHVQAVNIFEDSLLESVHWGHDVADPRINSTLDNLVILLCSEMSDITAIFPIFTKVKQQMSDHCSAPAIKALAMKMLLDELVGDTIEMLKRELPKIKKEDVLKLPMGPEYGYRELFDTLHNFVLQYTNEDTYETNWVLYGELHKYFKVPFESYLPAMKFFTDHDRLNGSLIIFRQIRMLSELHGNTGYLPPLRDMYMHLFQTFGDKLYEDGVEEVHESLKMDTAITKQDIELQNCVLNAYSNLQDVTRANGLFLAMSSVPKNIGGINEDTIQIMIKTYTYSDMAYVKEFWNNLSQYNVLPNYPIFKQYLIAHVYHGAVDEALLITEEMKDYDLEISSDTLLALHNYCLETSHQKKVADWASKNHKKEWDHAVLSGLLKGATNYVPDTNLITGSNS